MNPALKQVSFILRQELKYLSGLYPYDLTKYFNPRLLHLANIFACLKDPRELSEPFMERLTNLIAGIELLSIGTNHHNFNSGDFIKLAESINPVDVTDVGINGDKPDALNPNNGDKQGITGNPDSKSNRAGKIPAEIAGAKIKSRTQKTLLKSDKNYTVDLLFGDIFYSRAVIYLLKYGDHFIFESILDSLKSVHKNRLILHQKLSEVSSNASSNSSKGNREIDVEAGLRDLLEDNMVPVLGVNSLYKTSFLIGWGLFAGNGANRGVSDKSPGEPQLPYKMINDFMLGKALNDLAGFFNALPAEYFFLKDIKYMSEKKALIRNGLAITLAGLEQDWLKANYRSLGKLYL